MESYPWKMFGERDEIFKNSLTGWLNYFCTAEYYQQNKTILSNRHLRVNAVDDNKAYRSLKKTDLPATSHSRDLNKHHLIVRRGRFIAIFVKPLKEPHAQSQVILKKKLASL